MYKCSCDLQTLEKRWDRNCLLTRKYWLLMIGWFFFFHLFGKQLQYLQRSTDYPEGWAHNILNLWVTFDCKAVAQLTLLEALVGNLWRWQQICRKQTYYSAAGGKCSTKRDSMSALLASHFSGYQLRTKLPLRFFNLLFKLHLYWYQITLLGLYL